jgi:hypothetical protein
LIRNAIEETEQMVVEVIVAAVVVVMMMMITIIQCLYLNVSQQKVLYSKKEL